MTPVVILHLTDLHFGWSSTPDDLARRRRCLDSLVKSLRTLGNEQPEWKPTLVVISGDIGWKGVAADYQQAQQWLSQLLSEIGVTPDNVLACPGNHDINRLATRGIAVPPTAVEADDFLRPPLLPSYTGTFSAYTEFCQNTARYRPWTFNGETSWLVGSTELQGLKFMALNTAWYCRGELDQGQLWVGQPQLDLLIDGLPTVPEQQPADSPVIAICHHPFNWWQESELNAYPRTDGMGMRPSTEELLVMRSNLILTGHTHSSFRQPNHQRMSAYHLNGGAGYAGAGWLNAVRLLRVSAEGFVHRTLNFDPADAAGAWRVEPASNFLRFHPEQAVTGPAVPPDSAAIQHYLRRLTAETRGIQLLGMGRSFQVDLPIDEAYVPLRMVRFTRQREQDMPERLPQGQAGKGMPERESIERELTVEEDGANRDRRWMFRQCQQQHKRGVVVLGEPGAGKTTWARQLAWRLASGEARPEELGLAPGMRPVLLRLRNLAVEELKAGLSPLRSLQAFLQRETYSDGAPAGQQDPSQQFWDDSQRGILWILDGLDEVVELTLRETVAGWIRAAVKDRPYDWFVVTSRFQGYQSDRVLLGADFLEFHVHGLSDQQVRIFIERWFAAAHRRVDGPGQVAQQKALADTSTLTKVLETAPFQAPSMREMVTNPLLLTILCVVYHEEHNLPTGRAELYQHCVRVLLDVWRRAKYEHLVQQPAAFNSDAAQAVLARLAWWMHQEDQRSTAPLQELEQEAEQELKKLAESAGLGRVGKAFIVKMREESGILAMGGEGTRKCGFLHLSFQEYLAASYAVEQGYARQLAIRISDSWWQEVALLSLRKSVLFCENFFRELLAAGLAETREDLVQRCLTESISFPGQVLLDVLRDSRTSAVRRGAVLRLVRDKQQELPELQGLCEGIVADGKADRGLRESAVEILARFHQTTGTVWVAGGEKFQLGEVRVDERTGLTLVWIPPGEFRMGSTEGGSDERPVHTVVLRKGFWLSRYPVTNDDYRRFLRARPGVVKPPQYWDDRKFNQPKQPVVGITWYDAVAYCKWAGSDFRLPTEAEWEYACRAGGQHEYCFGSEPNQLGDYAWYGKNSGGQPQPIGSKRPNAWGLYDMHGNVWEWCGDSKRQYAKETVVDPHGGDTGSARVIRGGSWNSSARSVRAACRSGSEPGRADRYLGFRPLRVQQ